MLNDQLGIKEEAVFGTYLAPDRFFEFVNESISFDIPRMESAGLRPGARVQRTGRWKPGARGGGGSIEMEVASKGFGLWFKHCLGAIATSTPGGGTDTREHLATLGNLRGKSLTVQVGREDRGGVVRPFNYLGSKVASWELNCAIGEFLRLTTELLARDEDTVQGLAAASYPTATELLAFTEGSLTIGGVATPVRSFSMSGANGLEGDDYQFGSALRREPVEPALRDITGELDADWVDLTAYNRFKNGTEAALVLTFAAGEIEPGFNFGVVVTANVRFDGTTPQVGGREETRQALPYKVIAPAAGEPLSVLYRTTDLTP